MKSFISVFLSAADFLFLALFESNLYICLTPWVIWDNWNSTAELNCVDKTSSISSSFIYWEVISANQRVAFLFNLIAGKVGENKEWNV